MDDNITDEEMEKFAHLVGGTPSSEDKPSIHTFLHNVAMAEDTTKLGFLTEEEVGMPRLPIRTYKDLALFCSEVANMGYFSDYFSNKSEIITATSLSREGFLAKLAVIRRREIADVTKEKKINKGWFKPKPEIQPPQM